MKRLLIILLTLLPFCSFAQKQTFEQYKSDQNAKRVTYKSAKQKEYDDYRQKINAEHADYMANQWKAYKSFAAKSKPKDKDMPTPIVKNNDEPKGTDEIRYKLVIKIVPYEVPEPVVPIDEPPTEDKPQFKFLFHGTRCEAHLNNALKYTLPDASEQSASDMWKHLSNQTYDALISDCLELRHELQLGDWGYINLIQTLTNSFFGTNSNEAILMQMFLLTQSGYATRIARANNNRFVLLVPFNATLYDYSYFSMEGKHYYILDKESGSQNYYIFNKSFPKEQTPSLRMTESPKLTYVAAPPENKNLINFYNEYPLSTSWDYYSSASLSKETKQALYPILMREISGKSKYDAANMLINFVQTAFDYKTDDDQFGYERPLFGDETLYYPYSDCEDRSILYSILVRELLDLDVVLLLYPGHLATAVAFPNNQSYGYHFTYNNKVYTICDPTYINADAGDCMPEFRTTSPEVIQIL